MKTATQQKYHDSFVRQAATCPAEMTTKNMIQVRVNGIDLWECQSCNGVYSQDRIDAAERRLG